MAIAHHLLGVAALSLACAAAHADTAPPLGTTLQLVRYNDLNLEQPRDVARLFHRVSFAADRVCGTRSFANHYNKIAEFEACYKDTVANAVAHIDRPAVTGYFQQHGADVAASREMVARR